MRCHEWASTRNRDPTSKTSAIAIQLTKIVRNLLWQTKKNGILARLKPISLLVCEWANDDVRVGANQSDCSLLGLGLMLLDLECTSNCKACLALHRQQQLHQHQLHQQLA